jgi:hypothetical protein
MTTPEDFCRTWIFRSEDPSVQKAYPDGSTVVIGGQFEEEGKLKFMLAWVDRDRELHVLTDLTLDALGKLAASASQDLATGLKWSISIAYTPATADEPAIIKAEVGPAFLHSEGDLSGNWGAEAPPRDGDGQPS